MNVPMVEKNGWLIYNVLTGSRAYGTSNPDSDYDYRGIFALPVLERIRLTQLPEEVSGDPTRPDLTYYELAKFLRLAADCNPNIIELLFMPQDCIQVCTPAMQLVLDNRAAFVSTKAYHTFSGYAYAQIEKMRGQNKFVNNPQPVEHPKRENFCRFIGRGSMVSETAPCRPRPYAEALSDNGYPLEMCHAAKLEYVKDTYRLYFYGDEARGVFRDGNIACESIPVEDESRFVGMLVYNKDEYEKAVSMWRSYWTWMENRNPVRWKDQESGKVDYDCKNAMHCIRLLLSGESILATGEPIVRFHGARLQLLLDVLHGEWEYERVMAYVEKKMADLGQLKIDSKLPRASDMTVIERVFREIVLGA